VIYTQPERKARSSRFASSANASIGCGRKEGRHWPPNHHQKFKLRYYQVRAAFRKVFTTFIKRIPGKQWALMSEKSKTLGMPELADA
jgi:hypothetical protein